MNLLLHPSRGRREQVLVGWLMVALVRATLGRASEVRLSQPAPALDVHGLFVESIICPIAPKDVRLSPNSDFRKCRECIQSRIQKNLSRVRPLAEIRTIFSFPFSAAQELVRRSRQVYLKMRKQRNFLNE